ncbi:MAG: hypothetical protein O7G88_13425 [bacterium]|nr:hypothetical protein [bacterium]
MQVRCNFYGFTNASSGVECLIERDLLEVGEYFQYREQDYIIVSVVESQGCWFANVVPESQRRFLRQHSLPHRSAHGAGEGEALQTWRERVTRAEHKLQSLRQERAQFGERLDHLMRMLELLAKDPEDI